MIKPTDMGNRYGLRKEAFSETIDAFVVGKICRTSFSGYSDCFRYKNCTDISGCADDTSGKDFPQSPGLAVAASWV